MTIPTTLEVPKPFLFPILLNAGPGKCAYIPHALIAPHEAQAVKNHSQTLQRLAERGGLSWSEALSVLEDRQWQSIEGAQAKVLKIWMKWDAERNRPTTQATIYAEPYNSHLYAAPYAPEAVEKIRGELEAAVGCFDAANCEGLDDKLRDADIHETGSLADLVFRRLLHAPNHIAEALALLPTLAATQEPVKLDEAIEAMAKHHWDENYAENAGQAWDETREDNREWCREYVRDKHLPYLNTALAALERREGE